MRPVVCALAVLGWLASVCAAQEQPSYEQLKKQYEDTLKQLEMAQNRKAELSAENDSLKARLAESKKQLDQTQAKLEWLQKESAGWAERTHSLRSYQAAWRHFVRQYPRLWATWEAYLEGQLPREDCGDDTFFERRAPATGPAR